MTKRFITNPTIPKQQEDELNSRYFRQLTEKLSKNSCNILAFYAAKLVQHLNSDQRVTDCINLIEKWLKNPNSVTRKELCDAGIDINDYDNNNNIERTVVHAVWGAACLGNSTPSVAVAYTICHAINANIAIKDKLVVCISYLLPKEPEYNNFNIDLLKQNQQAYNFLGRISKLEDWQVTDDDLFGIRQIFDVLEEVGVPLDPNEFQWDGENNVCNEIIEKHRLLESIRREFYEIITIMGKNVIINQNYY